MQGRRCGEGDAGRLCGCVTVGRRGRGAQVGGKIDRGGPVKLHRDGWRRRPRHGVGGGPPVVMSGARAGQAAAGKRAWPSAAAAFPLGVSLTPPHPSRRVGERCARVRACVRVRPVGAGIRPVARDSDAGGPSSLPPPFHRRTGPTTTMTMPPPTAATVTDHMDDRDHGRRTGM